MLRFFHNQRLRSDRLRRREWLRLASLGGLALAAPAAINLQAGEAGPNRQAAGFGRAKSVIVVFANGGQSQIDMWDPKPNAPLDVRGAFRPIATAVPGLQLCEHLPRLAAIADKFTVVRSMSHEDLDHGSAAYLSLTGCYHARRSGNPPISPTDAPTYGAILRKLRGGTGALSDAVHLNGPALVPREPSPGQNGGFLGRAYEPLLVGDVRDASGAVPGLAVATDLSTARLHERLTLKQSLDRLTRNLEGNTRALDLNRLYGQAYNILANPQARQAFDLSQESAAIRDRYGRDRSGQALLLARRLVEAGVPYINVIWNHTNRGQDDSPDDTELNGWDTHNDIFAALQHRLLPRFDQSFSTLLADLDERGLLDQTLVICMGEFGRAPQVAVEPKFAGAGPGRKHWSSVYSIVFAGAGVKRGSIVGSSDRLGAEPLTDPFAPWDVAATLFNALGIPPTGHYSDPFGRPFAIAQGQVIEAVYRG
jgi:hypothetical protein